MMSDWHIPNETKVTSGELKLLRAKISGKPACNNDPPIACILESFIFLSIDTKTPLILIPDDIGHIQLAYLIQPHTGIQSYQWYPVSFRLRWIVRQRTDDLFNISYAVRAPLFVCTLLINYLQPRGRVGSDHAFFDKNNIKAPSLETCLLTDLVLIGSTSFKSKI
jgi:hypothetical protein